MFPETVYKALVLGGGVGGDVKREQRVLWEKRHVGWRGVALGEFL